MAFGRDLKRNNQNKHGSQSSRRQNLAHCGFSSLLVFFILTSAQAQNQFATTVESVESRVNQAVSILRATETPAWIAREFHEPGAAFEKVSIWLRGKDGPVPPEETLRFTNHYLVYFRGNLFSYQFHNRRAQAGKDVTWSALNQSQPWFEWNSQSQKYELRIGNANRGVLSTYSKHEKIRLYRGTIPEEELFLKAMKSMVERNICDSSVLQSLMGISRPETEISKALSSLLNQSSSSGRCSTIADQLIEAFAKDLNSRSSSHGALFFSAESEYAERFAKGTVLEIQVSRDELAALIPTDSLYIGCENGSEFALIGLAGLKTIIRGFVGSHFFFSDVYYLGDGISRNRIWRRATR